MPPKAKDKKGKQELLPTEDYTRRPLPATEPCDARPTPRREVPVVSAHHSFQEWDEDALADMEWGTAGAETLFEDKDGRCFLPPRMAARVVRWVRPRDLIVQKKDEAGEDGEELRQGGKGANSGVEKGKAAGGAEKGKAKSPKGKDKAPSSEPMVLEDSAADGEGNPLPRVIILPPTEAVPGDNGDGKDRNTGVVDTPDQTPDTASSGTTPPRGFKIGWSREQRQQITSLMRKTTQHLQQQQQQQALTENSSDSNEAPIEERETPPEKAVDGNLVGGNGINVSPQAGGSGETSGFLTDDEIATLGAPSGGDIDPAMTAIFKAVGQLSPTLYKTSCPLLWEAIYPKTSDGVPCYNPCGLYAIKLFAAGRWRKVEVDDCIPLDATRSPVIAASEDPVELWPLLLSKALYKLYRLGGYDLAQPQEVTTTTTTVEAVDTTTSSRDDATASSKDEGDGPSPASAPAKDATNGGVATGEINDEGADDEAMDEAEQARFVAFVLHSLAGWIPSVTTGISAETALLEGTPGLTPDDLHLPALPPVDVEEEAARERLEERKRRQALFLHKKRRPRKVERKVVSAEERAEVDSARLRKMRAVTQKLLQGTRREVYLVCMPGKPAYPVLAVCPQVSHENPNTAACQSGPPATTSPTSQQRQREGIPVTAGVGTSSSSTQRQEPSPSSSAAPSTAPTTPMETGVATAANADDEKDQPLGFLLKWEAPITPQQAPSVTSDTETPLGGQQQHERQYEGLEEGGRGGGAGEAGSEETGNRVLYGSGGRPRGHAKETAADATGAAPSSLSKPVCLWLSQREVELAGGTVVRAVTKVDMPAYADVQYHWKPVRPTEDAETPTAGNENAASSKDAKAKAKGKALGKGKDKDKDNAPAKGKAGKGEGNSSSGNSCHEAPSADIAVAEADRSPPGIVMVGGVAVPKGLEGVQARDPGSPPAIFLLVTPSPRPERKPVGQPQAQNQETPELDGALLEPPPAETGSAGNNESRETGNPPEVTVGEQDGNANRDYENSPALQDGRGCEEEKTSSGGADGDNEEEKEVEKEEEEEEEEEEAEIFMCLWVDKPGMGGGVGRTSSRFSAKVSDLYATAVLQEVLPGAQYTRGDFSKPVPGGRVVMCARHDPRRSGLPFTATSAKVRLKKGGTPRVFRVLLQPGVGCCVGFCCTHGIEAGDAGQVWEEAGYNQVTEIGKYEGVRPGEWKFLLRRGFRVTAESSPTHQSEGVVGSAVPEETSISAPEIALEAEGARDEQERAHGSNGDAGDAGTMATAENGGNSVGEALEGGLSPSPVPSAKDYCFVKAILHLPDEESRPSVRLAFVDEDTGLEMVQPTLHTNAVPLKPNKRGYSLLAAACHRARAIPKGAWRLQLLSDRPLLPLVDSLGNREGVTDSSPGPEKGVSAGDVGGESGQDGATTVVPCQERAVYGGIYVPNKYLLFFRDILTCASPLPFAIRLRCSLPGTCLRLKFLDAATGETLRDLRGKHVLQALTVTPPTAPESDPSAPPATEASAKGGSKGKGAASDATEKAVAAAPGKMIVEAAIDWTGMEVPPHLVSKLPHYFQPTPEDLPHYSPPLLEATSRILPRASTSEHPNEHGNGEEEGSRGEGQGGGGGGGGGGVERLRSSIAEDSSPITGSTAVSAGTGQADSSPEEGSNNSAATPTSAKSSLPTGEPLHWWLEIVGAGEVGMAHDTARVDRENAEVESWETAEPGRAARAALLWTQRQASKVARFGNGDTPSPPHYSSAETNASAARANATIDANPSPGAEGYEDWIKARAAAVGVPVALEKERQARRLALSTAPAGGTTMPVAPSSGSSSSAPTSPKQAVLIGEEELKQRAKEREALRHATAEFEKKWEEDRIKTVEAGKEHMAMQVKFMKEREEQIKEGRLPFLRDRDAIVYGIIAEAEARKEALEEERAALETASKGAKGKQAKGKPGKK
eukprot:g9601.t1